MSETQFQTAVVELAMRLGWRWFHVADSRKVVHRGGRPTVVPDPEAAGFPDLVLVHERQRRVIFAELKTDIGATKPKQRAWLEALARAGQEAYLWRPRHMDAIESILRAKP